MQDIVLASSNQGKLNEFQRLFENSDFAIIPQQQFSISDAIEDGLSFVENAILKARHCAKHSNKPCIADDSGLAVDALNGEPGIYSARYAGEHGNDASNIEKLLLALKTVPKEKRQARFHCVLVYLEHAADPTPIICHGIWQGEILEQARGEKGFGYDPIFYVPTHDCSAAELNPAIKNQISHRAQALHQLLKQLSSLNKL